MIIIFKRKQGYSKVDVKKNLNNIFINVIKLVITQDDKIAKT